MSSLLIFIISFVFSPICTQAANTGDSIYLAAMKGKRIKTFERGMYVAIKVKGEPLTTVSRGRIIGLPGDDIILSKNKKLDTVKIADITSIKKIRPAQRKAELIAGGIVGVGGAILLNYTKESWASLLPITMIGVGILCITAVPFSLLVEHLKERKASKGWHFSKTSVRQKILLPLKF